MTQSACRSGATAVVTGAASGIGFALSSAFADEGMNVLMLDIEPSALLAAASRLEHTGANVEVLVTDVTSPSDLQRAATFADERFGGADIIANNAGVSVKGRAWELTLADWQWVVDVCLWGTINGITAFVPGMVERSRPAHVLNTGSMMALGAHANGAPYQAAKSAIAAISESLQFDLEEAAPHVGVTLLCPGYTATNIRSGSRNRQKRYGTREPATYRSPPPVTSVVHADPAEIASLAIEAVKQRLFYAFADWDVWEPVVADRFDTLLARRPPRPLQLPPTGSPTWP